MRGPLTFERRLTMEFELCSRSPEESRRLGVAFGELAYPGLVVALIGNLGAGKTAFVRAVAEGLGVPDPRAVTSPTFVLIHEYDGRIPAYHFDVYRLANPQAFAELGVDEYFAGDGVSLVEWADRASEILPRERVEITFTPTGPTERRISVRGFGDEIGRFLADWKAKIV
jgi:tRNA threonylcarbamoyladenosine biosynthesis protein TsaE